MNAKNLIIIAISVILIFGTLFFFLDQKNNQELPKNNSVVDDGIPTNYVPEDESMPNLSGENKFFNLNDETDKSPKIIEKSINVSEWQTYVNESYNMELRFPDWWVVEMQEEMSGDMKNLQSIIWLSDKKDPYEGVTVMVVKDSLENTLNENKKRKDIIPFFAEEYYLNINNIPSVGFKGDDMYSEEYKKVYILGGKNFSYIIMTNSEDIRIFEGVLHSFNLTK